MARIGIVGIQGVGMAHAIAATKAGHTVVAVLDSDANASGVVFRPQWTNTWGEIVDTCFPKEAPVFTTDVERFMAVGLDLIIIATPTHTHIPLIRALDGVAPRILCEKPLCYDPEEAKALQGTLTSRLYVSHEWLFHPVLQEAHKDVVGFDLAECSYYGMGHNLPPRDHKSEKGVWWDLGIHLCAMYCVWGGKPENLKVISRGIKKDHAVVMCQGVLFEVGYDWGVTPPLLVGTDLALDWDQDLFLRQIQATLSDSHPVGLCVATRSLSFCQEACGDLGSTCSSVQHES